MEAILYTSLYMGLFIAMDRYIHKRNYQNPYYAVHTIHNALIVYNTAPDVYHSFTQLTDLSPYPTNWTAIQLCVALHLYHILLYWHTFRFDDWLHHVLMVGLALPLGSMIDGHTFMGMSLFFTTGLPGGIDYALLFGVRNGYVSREIEKKANTFLNVWIRSPGCLAMAALSAAYILSRQGDSDFLKAVAMIPPFLNYWNGQYFMQQVVQDSARIGWINLMG